MGSFTSYPGQSTTTLFTVGHWPKHILYGYIHFYPSLQLIINDTILVSFVKKNF